MKKGNKSIYLILLLILFFRYVWKIYDSTYDVVHLRIGHHYVWTCYSIIHILVSTWLLEKQNVHRGGDKLISATKVFASIVAGNVIAGGAVAIFAICLGYSFRLVLCMLFMSISLFGIITTIVTTATAKFMVIHKYRKRFFIFMLYIAILFSYPLFSHLIGCELNCYYVYSCLLGLFLLLVSPLIVKRL